MDFYTIVSIIALILLVITLTLIAVYIPFTSGGNYPTYMQPCPDGWKLNEGNLCTSIDGNTNANSHIINPAANNPTIYLNLSTDSKYSFYPLNPVSNFSYKSGSNTYSGICGYKKWASDSSGITWDGVTNYDKC